MFKTKRFPTQIEDGYAALNWVYNHADELNINREKIIVCGDSAGGTIASVCSLMSRDRQGNAFFMFFIFIIIVILLRHYIITSTDITIMTLILGPKIMRQILVYPCVQNPLDDSLQSQIKYRDGPIVLFLLLY